ncbi:transposase [Serratia bockelmannii]|uniref:transposase n=1 Tax=Serratia TaxID=613 RepID=UPI003D9F5DE6
MVVLASQPGDSVAQVAREYGINDNVIFKWLRLRQNEGRISRRPPATRWHSLLHRCYSC